MDEILISIKFKTEKWSDEIKKCLSELMNDLLLLKWYHDLDFTFSIDKELE